MTRQLQATIYAALITALAASSVTKAQDDYFDITVGNQSLRFAHIPDRENIGFNLPDFEIRGLYLMTTEVSCQTLKAILSDEEYQSYVSVVTANIGNDEEAQKAWVLFQNGSADQAAIIVSLNEMRMITTRLQEAIDRAPPGGINPAIESLTVRLPSRTEWQAAAVMDLEDRSGDLPSFSKWPKLTDAADADSRVKFQLADLESDLNKKIEQITPKELIQESMQRESAEKLLALLLQSSAGLNLGEDALISRESSEFSNSGDPDRSVSQSFGTVGPFLNLFGNATEFVISVDENSSNLNQLWNAQTLDSDKFRFVDVGGTTYVGYNGNYRQFQIDGGTIDQMEANSTYTIEDMQPETIPDIGNPGFRLLICKRLADNWFVEFRKQNHSRGEVGVDVFGIFKRHIEALCPLQERAEPTSLLACYECLADAKVVENPQPVLKIAIDFDQSVKATTGGGIDPGLAAIIADINAGGDGSNVDESSTGRNGDGYFELYQELYGRTAAN